MFGCGLCCFLPLHTGSLHPNCPDELSSTAGAPTHPSRAFVPGCRLTRFRQRPFRSPPAREPSRGAGPLGKAGVRHHRSASPFAVTLPLSSRRAQGPPTPNSALGSLPNAKSRVGGPSPILMRACSIPRPFCLGLRIVQNQDPIIKGCPRIPHRENAQCHLSILPQPRVRCDLLDRVQRSSDVRAKTEHPGLLGFTPVGKSREIPTR
jgi:hypothetical protein